MISKFKEGNLSTLKLNEHESKLEIFTIKIGEDHSYLIDAKSV